jgi:hypothetical protein
MRVLLPVKLKPDENLAGYIIRVAERNGYASPVTVLTAANINLTTAYAKISFALHKSPALIGLAELVGVNKEELIPLTYPTRARIGRTERKTAIFSKPIPHAAILLKQAKVCPECLSEETYCRRVWDLALVTVCPKHRRMLIDECPNCSQRIKWRRCSISICPCDFDLRNFAPECVEDEDIKVSHRIHQLCNLPAGIFELNDSPETNPLMTLGLDDLISTLILIAGQFQGTSLFLSGRHFIGKQNKSEFHALLKKAFSVFEDWPSRFFSFLDWLRKRENGSKKQTGLEKDFYHLYRLLAYKSYAASRFDFIREAFENYVMEHWDGAYFVTRRYRWMSKKSDSKYITMVAAMRYLGIPRQEWIVRLVERGELKAIVHDLGARKRYRFEKSSVEEWKSRLDQSLSVQEVANYLSIDRAKVLDLVEQGYLSLFRGPTLDGTIVRRFEKSAVDNLLNKIKSKVRNSPHIRTNDQLTMRHIFGNVWPYTMMRFVKAILNDEIIPIGIGTGRGLMQFLFSKKQIADYVKSQILSMKGNALDFTEAAKVIGIPSTDLLFLRKKGLIRFHKVSLLKWRYLSISKQELKVFTSTYVMASVIARQLHTHSSRLIRRLATQGIVPISGPKIDGGIRCVLLRADLEGIDLVKLMRR